MELKRRFIKLMGAAIDIVIYVDEKQNGEKILDGAIELLNKYNKVFSANDRNSELMKINKSAGEKGVVVCKELFNLIEIAKKHSLEDGFLNVALGPIVKEWKIGFNDAKVADKSRIEKLLELTDPSRIMLDEKNKEVYLTKKGMQIDLGAIAKGYIADLVVEYLKKKEVKSGYINLGGNFLTFGTAYHDEDSFWKIGIQNPILSRGNYLCVLKIQNQSVVTSGIYERVLEKNGKRYHHILDPKTGYPIDCDIESLTIVSKKSVDCEIWTTQLFGEEIADIMDKIEEKKHIEGLVVTKSGKVYYTSGLHEYIL